MATPADLIEQLRAEASQRTGVVRDLLLAAAGELAELERLKATIAETAELARGDGLRRFAAAVAEEGAR